ncbi:MAG: phosphoadenosine phosphosulfate reductase family protein [Candidatus Gastranaerophilales bacterium]
MDNKTKEQGQMLDCHADASNDEKVHHILSLSGGKDSTALAFFMKENNPEIFEQIELVFCDTEVDLPETYDYLNKIEVFLNKEILRIKPKQSFEHFFTIYGILPSAMKRWCTIEMKTKTFQKYLKDKLAKDSDVRIYIGIRADEASRVNNSHDTEKLKQIYPFVDNSIIKSDVEKILLKNGIGLPDYYNWRSRSGCFFCFFQKKIEWIGLLENHPTLFKKALQYEQIGADKRGKSFTWCQDMSLSELKKESTINKIKKSNTKEKIEIDKSLFHNLL